MDGGVEIIHTYLLNCRQAAFAVTLVVQEYRGQADVGAHIAHVQGHIADAAVVTDIVPDVELGRGSPGKEYEDSRDLQDTKETCTRRHDVRPRVVKPASVAEFLWSAGGKTLFLAQSGSMSPYQAVVKLLERKGGSALWLLFSPSMLVIFALRLSTVTSPYTCMSYAGIKYQVGRQEGTSRHNQGSDWIHRGTTQGSQPQIRDRPVCSRAMALLAARAIL